MQLLIGSIHKLKIGWNERPLSESDLAELARRLDVEIVETQMTVRGMYFRVLGRDTIAVDSDLNRFERLLVLFHEIGHLLFHAPHSGPAANFHHVGRPTRQEVEADVFAYCALIPASWITEKTLEELVDEEGVSADAVNFRIAIMKRFGI